jgi:hypothetical protein
VRQRNDTEYTQHVMAWPTEEHPDYAPFEVAPGEVTDRHHELLAGFTALEDEKPPASRKTAAASPAQTEGVETP